MSVRRHPLLWSLGVWSALFVVPVGLAATNDLSFSIEAVDKVTKTTWPTVWTLLTVSHARVIFSYAPHVKTYLGQESPSYGFPADGLPTTEASCTDFVRETTVGSEHVLKFKFANHGDVYEHGTFAISVKQKGMNSRALLQQVKDACGTQQIEEDHRAQIEREEAERKRKEADAAWQADVEAKRRLYEEETRQIAQQREEARLAFAKSILAALRFADEPDPFASVRGEFDLSASDSRQWKTSLQLAGADVYKRQVRHRAIRVRQCRPHDDGPRQRHRSEIRGDRLLRVPRQLRTPDSNLEGRHSELCERRHAELPGGLLRRLLPDHESVSGEAGQPPVLEDLQRRRLLPLGYQGRERGGGQCGRR